ncbi:septum site-determining protein MinC [Alkalicoccus chagannorensis]|uniref:septum site-determining protein MinC n=1 Tax=Alkalicoccus chagannorensis TaxID=427072 RepID=UPI000427F058|nr:septum site-determining protein MinC [Alkalicoccus chagannorensis]
MTKHVQQYVVLRGTRQGLELKLDDKCSFHLLMEELERTLKEKQQQFAAPEGRELHVTVDAGFRYIGPEDEAAVRRLLEDEFAVSIDAFESDVLSKQEAENMLKAQKMTTMYHVLRSGQVVEIEGSVLLIGDVNPGAEIKATGSIYILGSLKGTAHAGTEGEVRSVICASFMDPSQLRIAHIVRHPPENDEEEVWRGIFECAYVNEEGVLTLDRSVKLSALRPEHAGPPDE